MCSIKRLEWDSSFFGYEVGRVSIDVASEFNHTSFILEAQAFDLVYVYSKVDLIYPSFFLSDRKIILERTNSFFQTDEISNDFEVRKFDPHFDNKISLINLGLQSGTYSRFKLDPNFKNNEYDKLYTFWIEKMLNEPTAEVWILVSERNELIGFIALDQLGKDHIDIVLVGVDEKFRGKGFGKVLMAKVLQEISDRSFKLVKVTTQLENIPAVNLYKAFDFKIVQQSNIYHFWKK